VGPNETATVGPNQVAKSILARGGLLDILAQLKAERDKAAQQVNALDTAIKALSGVNSTGGSRGPRRRISAKGLANIRAAQRARRTRETGQKVVSIAPKRHISAAGLARIRAANRARWARVRRSK